MSAGSYLQYQKYIYNRVHASHYFAANLPNIYIYIGYIPVYTYRYIYNMIIYSCMYVIIIFMYIRIYVKRDKQRAELIYTKIIYGSFKK